MKLPRQAAPSRHVRDGLPAPSPRISTG